VEAELSEWLRTETAHGEKRKSAEELFINRGVEVKVEQGMFTRICGSEADVNRLELDLMRLYVPGVINGHVSELCSSDWNDTCRSISYQIPVKNTREEAPVNPLHNLVASPHSVHRSTADTADGISADRKLPNVRDTTTQEAHEEFVDEMDVEKYIWHYLLFKHANLLGELASNYHCGVSLRRSAVDVNGRTQYRLRVSSPTQGGLNAACDTLAGMVVKLTEANVVQQKVEPHPDECFRKLKDQLQEREMLLMTPAWYVIGPATALDAARSLVNDTVNEMYAKRPHSAAVSGDVREKDTFSFEIPLVGLTVHVRQGL